MRPRPPWMVNSLLVFASTAATVLAIEVTLRALTREGRLLETALVGSQLIDVARIQADSTRLRALFDPELGWVTLDEDERGFPSAGRPRIVTRGARSYAPHAPAGVLRVCAFGESFTRGDGVRAAETWPSRVEARMEGRVEVPNFGVGGYAIDQAYLCFHRHGLNYHPDVVLLGLTPYAIERTTNLYRPFYSHGTGIALAKPRFVVDGDSLRSVVSVVPDPIDFLDEIFDFSRHPLRQYEGYYDAAIYESSWLDRSRVAWLVRSRLAWRRRSRRLSTERIANPASEEIAITRLLVRRMATETEALGARYVVGIFPTYRTLRILRAEGRDLWAPLRQEIAAAGIEVWDLQETLTQEPEFSRYFLPDGHLTAEGNDRLAEAVIGHLETWGVRAGEGR